MLIIIKRMTCVMAKRKTYDTSRHCPLSILAVLLWEIFFPISALADEIQFNADILDTKDRGNIDLNRFSRKGYIMPGGYTFSVLINNRSLGEHLITVTSDDQSESGSMVCLPAPLVDLMGLKPSVVKEITWLNDGQCMDITSLKGMTLRPDLSVASLYINLPQAYLEYSDPNWDPPVRWDDGIPATLFDYNLIARQTHYSSTHEKDKALSGNGIAGVNLGPWRFRSIWQMQANERSGNNTHQRQRSWEWSQLYAYRALRGLGAKLTVGEDYLSSGIFDSFRFTGANLVTDDSMLPPNLRGYAPEVVGVARTNAKVVISQQGRIIYESLVATGPFRIQTLSDSVSGSLDVRVEEQDGSVQQFTVETSTIPDLTRPGLVRYKFAAGKPSTIDHDLQGQIFSAGEFSWGISNGWSLYGGGIASGDYNALALGIGRDLLAFGALSIDVTKLPLQDIVLPSAIL
jgi:outer membrane usher protein PapC